MINRQHLANQRLIARPKKSLNGTKKDIDATLSIWEGDLYQMQANASNLKGTTKMTKFNGHKNWNHWNVSLWIGNDEGLYRMALTAIRRNSNRAQAASDMLCDLPDKTPDGAPYSLSAIRAALVGMERS